MRRLAALIVLGALLAGCGSVVRAFLDVPAPKPAATVPAAAHVVVREDSIVARPLLETTLDPDSVLALLPRDWIGHADWVAALQKGLIRPRPAIGARFEDGPAPFGFDFYFAGKDSSFDAFFPHSVHSQIIACNHCHGRIFRYRNMRFTMEDLLAGRYCGECHSKVSFPVVSGCDRCHPRIKLPARRTEARLLGTVQMARVTDGSGMAPNTPDADLPPARFPHWVHRIRYQCRVCHVQIFEPRAGANRMTMKDISEGRACGRCHDGTTAFRAGFGNCQRCHVAGPPPAPVDTTGVDSLLLRVRG